MLPVAAPAQDLKQKPIRTEKITAASPESIGLNVFRARRNRADRLAGGRDDRRRPR